MLSEDNIFTDDKNGDLVIIDNELINLKDAYKNRSLKKECFFCRRKDLLNIFNLCFSVRCVDKTDKVFAEKAIYNKFYVCNLCKDTYNIVGVKWLG